MRLRGVAAPTAPLAGLPVRRLARAPGRGGRGRGRLKALGRHTESICMAEKGQILLVESLDGSSHKLAERLMQFDVEPVRVADFDEALSALAAARVPFAGVMVPTSWPVQNLKKQLKALRKQGPAGGLSFVSIGKPPPREERTKLRAAGLQIALWEPYDDGTVRFQLNRALGGDRASHGRTHDRAPTYLLARIFVGDRVKDAVVYSLSEGGAFLETPRASMDGARIELELRLPGNPIRVAGTVIFSNVPGNLQRPNLPLGMGVRFDPLDDDALASVRRFVAERLAELDV